MKTNVITTQKKTNIPAIVQARGIRYKDAQATGLGNVTLSKILAGDMNVTLTCFVAFCEKLSIPLADALTGTELQP
jgi:DNA-binding Xre family transcriptional regulator